MKARPGTLRELDSGRQVFDLTRHMPRIGFTHGWSGNSMAASDAKETTMSQQQKDALRSIFRNAPLDIGGDPIEQRTNFEKMLSAQPLADDVTATPGELGGVPVLNIETGESSHDAVMLWFHGGWYVIGSPRTSAGLSADVARRGAARAVSIDYRLAPEHPYPAALQDAQAAYKALLGSGVDPAGGGLATATMASLGDLGLPQPSCAVLFSPWTDLTL